MPQKADIDFLYNWANDLQKAFNLEFKNHSKLLLGLSSGVLTLLISQSKILPKSDLFFYIYLVLLISIFSGVGVQYFYVKFTRSQTKKVKIAISDINKSQPENHASIFSSLKKDVQIHPSLTLLKICASVQTLLFLISFLLLAKIVLWP